MTDYEVVVSVEHVRGCGYRTAGKTGVGVYLMSDGLGERCERLPFPLLVCPCCGNGIKFSRTWTWVDAQKLFAPELAPLCNPVTSHNHHLCPMCTPKVIPGGRAGLIWVGRGYYKTPEHFIKETQTMGLSRKLHTIPYGLSDKLKKQELVVFVAHLDAIKNFIVNDAGDQEEICAPGVFSAFRPTHIDLVIDDENEIPDRAKRLKDRMGDCVQIVKVERAESESEQLSIL